MARSIKRDAFIKLLTAGLYPVLRAEGFRGSGTTLRRLVPPAVHIFNLQGSTDAVSFYLNLGCHYDFLPAIMGPPPDLKSMSHGECLFHFRDRMVSSAQDGGWFYGTSEAEAVETVRQIVEEWPRQAHAFFKRHEYPDGLLKMVAEVPLTRPSAVLFSMAQAAAQFQQKARAVELARVALRDVGPESGAFTRIQKFLRQMDSPAESIHSIPGTLPDGNRT
jgi:hypothetical protein